MVCLLAKPTGVYRPRQHLESDFHRLVREHFDEFRTLYPERHARKFGFWRPVFDKAIHHFLKCGDLQEGFARVRCPDCRHEFLVAFSCKQRCICPSCSQKRTVLFGIHVAEDVCLDVPHRQFVWTIPKRLRIFFRFHRGLLHQLPNLAWQSLLETYRAVLGDDAVPGGVLAIQTFGQLIHFHPHIHGLITDGAFTPDGRFLRLPLNLTHQPFLRLWEDGVFRLLLDHNLIQPALVDQLRSWRHTGFNINRSVCLQPGDTDGIERLAQYMARSPFSLARIIRITPAGKVIYKAEKEHCQKFPDPASADLFAGVRRNFQIFEPLDFLAELTQHIPNKGEHLIRYYGHYSNKARGMRAKQAVPADENGDWLRRRLAVPVPVFENPAPGQHHQPIPAPSARLARRRWAILIRRVYQADPLRCPHCGGTMKIIAFIEAHQQDIIRNILQHCGLPPEGPKGWQDPPLRGPPKPAHLPPGPKPGRQGSLFAEEGNPDSRRTHEVDPDFLEFLRREDIDEPEPTWEP